MAGQHEDPGTSESSGAGVVNDQRSRGTLLADLGEQYFRTKHRWDPWNATLLGLSEFDALVPDPSESADQRAAHTFRDIERTARAIDPADLDHEQQIDREVLLALAAGAASDAEDALWAANVSAKAYVSPQGLLFQAIPIMDATRSDGEPYLARLRALPQVLDGLIDRYRAEIARGRTPPGVGVSRAIEQVQDYLATPLDQDVLLAPARAGTCRGRAERLVADRIRPAFQEFATRLGGEIQPHGRPDDRVGACAIPGGDVAYAHAVARHTTTDRSPADIHRLGLDILDDLDREWSSRGAEALRVTSAADVRTALRSDPSLRFSTREEILATCTVTMSRARERLASYYRGPAIGPCDIIEINAAEEGQASGAYYRPPADDGSRNGAFCVLTADPESRLRYEADALTFHESIPGHHLQLSCCQQLDIPRYRRHLDVELCCFNEGWGLYSELLAEELGLYSSAITRLGRISMTALRACRLVVDTGIHHFGWSRDRALAFMRDHTAANESDIVAEVDRYIAWPGQALAYMIGAQEILRIRRDARQRLGAAFDLGDFHHRVLRNGAVPLPVLARDMQAWQRDR